MAIHGLARSSLVHSLSLFPRVAPFDSVLIRGAPAKSVAVCKHIANASAHVIALAYLRAGGDGVRIVLSRKGLDSAAGGFPSPIIAGRPVSICIPARTMPTPTTYGRLNGDIGPLVQDLSGGLLGPDSPCHLDPDIDQKVLPRSPGWRGALGQVGAAQSHLDNQGVGTGDVFVFWGLFRQVERRSGTWRYVSKKEHRTFGWLQVGDVLRVGSDHGRHLAKYPWLRDHPHVRPGWDAKNTVYVASETLRLAGEELGVPGWGVFRRGLRLTQAGKSPSNWTVPDWLNPKRGGTGMTYHRADAFSDNGSLRAAARGQEFVADVTGRRDAVVWLRALIEGDV